jgi:hypothetical protein
MFFKDLKQQNNQDDAQNESGKKLTDIEIAEINGNYHSNNKSVKSNIH